MPELVLAGCRPVPLAHYLKALGVLRLVSEQKDPSARGFWRRERFVLQTDLDREALERFFLEEYRPTPMVGPWGARSGFYPDPSEKAARLALEDIAGTSNPRFAEFIETAERVRSMLGELGIERKEQVDARKSDIMELCRARLPDEAVVWLDACFVLLGDDERFPPLLGSGGNEGSGSYMSGFTQQLAACVVRREHDSSLRAALWEKCQPGVTGAQTPGHFIPSAGGANASPGFGEKPRINPWDYLLCLEGALVFASSVSRRFDKDSPSRTASFPFTVDATLAGYATAAAEEVRGEMWLPLWSRASSGREVTAMFREGRVTIGRRTARDGLDFARAVGSLSVDRGIESFCRFGFQKRNGQNNIAVPLGAFCVRSRVGVSLLSEIDAWLERFRWKAKSQIAPASAKSALRQLEASIFDLCAHGDFIRLQQVFVALGRCEQVMAKSARWTAESYLQPVPPLSPDWLRQIDDDSVELRLAASLACVYGSYGSAESKGTFRPLRAQLEPVRTWRTDAGLRARWDFDASHDVAWTSGHLTDALNAVLRRRLVLAIQEGASTYPDRGRLAASLGDIADFIEGRVAESQLSALLWGCTLIDWSRLKSRHAPKRRAQGRGPLPGALYSLLKLCFPGPASRSRSDGSASSHASEGEMSDVPIVLEIHRLAAAGQGAEASKEAIRRLRGSGLAPAVTPFQVKGAAASRTAAALLFPISAVDREFLTRMITRPEQAEPTTESAATTTESGVIE